MGRTGTLRLWIVFFVGERTQGNEDEEGFLPPDLVCMYFVYGEIPGENAYPGYQICILVIECDGSE